jgi:hypothetical protein
MAGIVPLGAGDVVVIGPPRVDLLTVLGRVHLLIPTVNRNS